MPRVEAPRAVSEGSVSRTGSNGLGGPGAVLSELVGRHERLVTRAEGVTEEVQGFAGVVADRSNRRNTDRPEEVGGGASRSNKLTASSKGLGSGGELTKKVVAAFNLQTNDVVKRTFDTGVSDPVQGPEAGVFERSSETVLVVEGRHG
jgi:hypothetical protein